MRPGTVRMATFSSGSMPCALTACARWRIAGLCLTPFDHQGLLTGAPWLSAPADSMDDDELLAELEGAADHDITELRHVRTSAEKREAEEIANREKCQDFEKFKPLFQQVQRHEAGLRTTRPFVKDAGFLKAEIKAGQFFILGGQTAYVADVGELFNAQNGESDARLRVIYSTTGPKAICSYGRFSAPSTRTRLAGA